MASDVTYNIHHILEALNRHLSEILFVNKNLSSYPEEFEYQNVNDIITILDKWVDDSVDLKTLRLVVRNLTTGGHDIVNTHILAKRAEEFTEYIRKLLVIGSVAKDPIHISRLALPLRYALNDPRIYSGPIPTAFEFIYDSFSYIDPIRQVYTVLVLATLIGNITEDVPDYIHGNSILYGLQKLKGCGIPQMDIYADFLYVNLEPVVEQIFNVKEIFGHYMAIITDEDSIKCNGVFGTHAMQYRDVFSAIFSPRAAPQPLHSKNKTETNAYDLQSVVTGLKVLGVISGIKLKDVGIWNNYLLTHHRGVIAYDEWRVVAGVVVELRELGYINIEISHLANEMEARGYHDFILSGEVLNLKLPWWLLCLSTIYILSLHSIHIPLSAQSFDGDLYRWAESNRRYINDV